MHLVRTARRSIRYSVIVGVLVGSVFAGSGAFAIDPTPISSQAELEAIGTNDETRAGDYFLDFDSPSLTLTSPSSSTYISGSFTGTFDGRGKTLGGLVAPLFDQIGISGNGATVTNLSLETNGTDFLGEGVLARGSTEALVDSVSVVSTDPISVAASNVGGMIGNALDTQIDNSSFTGVIQSAGSAVGGLVGYIDCSSRGGASVCEPGTSTVSNSHVNGEVVGFDSVGGLVGGGYGSISGSHADVIVSGNWYVGGLVGWSEMTISNSFSSGLITSIGDGAGGISGGQGAFTVSNSYSTAEVQGNTSVGGLIGYTYGNLENSFATGNVSSGISGSYVGGLIGYTENSIINNSYATGNVTGSDQVGGLIGGIYETQVSNSFATGTVEVLSYGGGGLIGTSYNSSITNAASTGNITGIGSASQLGGAAGYAEYSTIEDVSYSGSIAGFQNLGGLIGYAGYNTEIISGTVVANMIGNSYLGGVAGSVDPGFELSNTVVNANLQGGEAIGGLIGLARSGYAASDIIINNSYWKGTLYSSSSENYTASAIAYTDRLDDPSTYPYYSFYTVLDESFNWFSARIDGVNVVGRVSAPEWTGVVSIPNTTSVLQNIATERQTGNTWAICSTINNSNPYLISLVATDPCPGDDAPLPSDLSIRERIKREVREVAESRTLEKIEKSVGFKNETPLPKSAPIAFVESTEKIDPAKVKAVEIASTANVKVSAKAGEALQISLKSESKDPVELWLKSPDGTWLLAGVITFDKDGKAILPPLQFKSAGDYSLVLSKPSADSAKGSAPLNQTGSLLVAVS